MLLFIFLQKGYETFLGDRLHFSCKIPKWLPENYIEHNSLFSIYKPKILHLEIDMKWCHGQVNLWLFLLKVIHFSWCINRLVNWSRLMHQPTHNGSSYSSRVGWCINRLEIYSRLMHQPTHEKGLIIPTVHWLICVSWHLFLHKKWTILQCLNY